jgi:hypothetical protein
MKKKILFMASLIGAMMLTACSSEDNSAEQGGRVDVAKGITFQFSEEAFVPGVIGDKETQGTRVGMQPQSVDLGNGLVAEMSIEPDTAGTPQTRAPQPMSDGHYKIYAVDANNVRHNGLSGTITAGVFTPDVAGQRWKLKPGETYTFVCINDAVTDNGTSLTVSYTAQNAMIGVTQHTVSATTDKDVVAFEMKHQQPRVRYQITSYTAPCVGAKINFASDSGPDWGTENFNLRGQSTGLGNNGFLDGDNIPMTSTATVEYSPYVKAYKVSTPYQYYAEGSNLRYIQSFSFNGTLHGKDLATKTTAGSTLRNKISSMTNAAATIHKNHSYVVNIKLKSKDPLVLFQDGTVGYMGDKGTRTPIGLVIEQRTETTDGLAVALKDAARQSLSHVVTWYRESAPAKQFNSSVSTSLTDHLNDMNGYFWTYDPAGSLDGKSKATEAQAETESYGVFTGGKYVAFYMATRYDPGVGLTFSGGKRGKWFLPSLGQLVKMMKVLGNTNEVPDSFSPFGSITMPGGVANFDIDALTNAFMYAGGQILDSYWYWSSSEYDNTHVSGLSLDKMSELKYYLVLDSKFIYGSDVRSFIHF